MVFLLVLLPLFLLTIFGKCITGENPSSNQRVCHRIPQTLDIEITVGWMLMKIIPYKSVGKPESSTCTEKLTHFYFWLVTEQLCDQAPLLWKFQQLPCSRIIAKVVVNIYIHRIYQHLTVWAQIVVPNELWMKKNEQRDVHVNLNIDIDK